MNALERRLTNLSECSLVGSLARALTDFQQLEQELEEARWQWRMGVIDDERYVAFCRELDVRLDPLALFLERHRASVTRFLPLEKTVDSRLSARATAACRAMVEPLARWFEELSHAEFAIADPSFHVRFERLLENAEDVIATQINPVTSVPPPQEEELVPTAEKLRELARADALRALNDAEQTIHDKALSQQDWQRLASFRDAIKSALDEGSEHEAFWVALALASWVASVAVRAQPSTFRHSKTEHRRFCKAAARLGATLQRRRA